MLEIRPANTLTVPSFASRTVNLDVDLGALAIRYVFSTATADSDPGKGRLRLSATQQDTALTIRADTKDVNGADVSALLDAFGGSTSATKGHLRIYALGDPNRWLTFEVIAVASPAGYRNIAVAGVSASEANPFADGDVVLLSFAPTGERGQVGPAGSGSTYDTVAVAADAAIDPAINGVRTLGKAAVGDGGGGLYAPVASEPATQPKFFNANVNRWFTGTETVMDIMRFGAMRLGSGTSGAIAANNAAFADAKEWLHGRLLGTDANASKNALPELQVGAGVYDYDAFPNFAKRRATVRGLGDVRLRYHGMSTAVVLDGEAVDGVNDGAWAMAFTGFIIEPTEGASQNGDGILLRAIHESDIAVEVRGGRNDGSKAGMRLEWCVSPRILYRCSVNGFGWYAGSPPSYGILIDDHPTYLLSDYTATSLAQINCDITGPNIGIGARQTNSCMILGTIQSCAQAGIFAEAGCVRSVFYNMDLEAHPTDAVVMQGTDNDFRGVYSLQRVAFSGAAKRNRVIGGLIDEVLLAGGTSNNTIATSVNLSGTGGITDLGTGNSIAGSTDVVNNSRITRPKTTITPTPAGTVYAWTNTYGDPMILSLKGGSVQGMQVNGEDAALPSSAAQYMIPPGKAASWDASAAPTAKVWSL